MRRRTWNLSGRRPGFDVMKEIMEDRLRAIHSGEVVLDTEEKKDADRSV